MIIYCDCFLHHVRPVIDGVTGNVRLESIDHRLYAVEAHVVQIFEEVGRDLLLNVGAISGLGRKWQQSGVDQLFDPGKGALHLVEKTPLCVF